MTDNPYVREIKLFHPETDLDVDRPAGGRRTVRKPRPVMPSEGLLDPVGKEKPAASAAAAPAKPAAAKPAAAAPETPPAPAAIVQGDAPEIIEGDFPEPLDF